MRRPSKLLSSCESCRKLKRKCDYMELEDGPCSNCVMRSIGHLCSLARGNEGSKVRLRKRRFNASEQNNSSQHERRSSVRDLTRIDQETSSAADTTGAGSSCGSATSPESDSGVYSPFITRLPVTLLCSCIVRLFQTEEWSFFLDQNKLTMTLLDITRPSPIVNDLHTLSLVYICCADVIMLRGAQISSPKNYQGDRLDLAGEMFLLYTKISESLAGHPLTLETCQGYIIQSHYWIHMENLDKAWTVLYQAIALYNSFALPKGPLKVEYEKTWVALCILEASLCELADRKSFLSSLSQAHLKFDDFKMERRWQVLSFERKTQQTLNEDYKSESTEKNDKQTALEHDIENYIAHITNYEGILLPYGQIALYVCLIKLKSQRIVRYNPHLQDPQKRDSTLEQVSQHGSMLVEYLRRCKFGACQPFVSSSPFLCLAVFQSFICIWILSAFTARELNYDKFEGLKNTFKMLSDDLHANTMPCKQSTTLYYSLDILSKAKFTTGSYKVPKQLEVGISTISKPWNDSCEDPESWLNFEHYIDDSMFWNFLMSQTKFNTSLKVDTNSEDLLTLN